MVLPMSFPRAFPISCATDSTGAPLARRCCAHLHLALVKDDIKRRSRVAHVHVRAGRLSVTVDGNLVAVASEHDELGNGLPGYWLGP